MSFFEDGYGSFGGLAYPDVSNDEANILIVGIPYEGAISGKQGTSRGPREIRNTCRNLQTMTRASTDLNQLILKDLGDVEVFPIEGEKTRQSIANTYNELFSNHNTPILTIGGDHSITYPIVKGFQTDAKIGIIWFDAHRDLLQKLNGSSYSHGSSLKRITELPNVEYENILLVGTRYMDPEEELFVNDQKIPEIKMVDIEDDEYPIQTIVQTISEIAGRVDHLYISIDIDVLDPAFAPGTGTQVGGGMTTSMLMQIIGKIDCKVRAYDIVEFSPLIDPSGITNKAILGIISEILGQITQTYEY